MHEHENTMITLFLFYSWTKKMHLVLTKKKTGSSPLSYAAHSLKLAKDIEVIKENGLTEMKTQVDLGSNFYVQAKM